MTTAHRHYITNSSHLILAACAVMSNCIAFAQDHAHESVPATDSARVKDTRPAPSVTSWTKTPIIIPAGKPENGNPVLGSMNTDTADLLVFSPDVNNPPLKINKTAGRWLVKPVERDVGGIHLLHARKISETEIRLATTTWMFHAKAPSPATMLSTSRPGLVIQPLRIPEHGGFREGSTWKFLVRFNGNPMPSARLAFDTENGSRSTLVADETGVVNVTFPHDFDAASIDKKAGTARSRRSFSLGTETERDGIHHISGFNHFYYPDQMRERNLLAGMGLFAFGMVLATPMLRRKKEKSHA